MKEMIFTDGKLNLSADRPPLREDEGGIVRIGNSRVSLDVLVEEYENGMTPDEMVSAYDSLAMADVYGAIAFYLRHRDEVQFYMKRRNDEAEALRVEIESRHPPIRRAELMARRERERNHVAVGQ